MSGGRPLDYFSVSEYGVGGWTWQIEIDEEVAFDSSDAVDRMVRDLVAALPGVDAVRSDREVILVRGPVKGVELLNWALEWWGRFAASR